jgi:hypothetical protein
LPADARIVDVAGDDADLATAAAADPDAVLRFTPTAASDLARSLGLGVGAPGTGPTVVACDRLDLDDGLVAVNAVVLGTAPDRLRARHRMHPVVVEVDGRVVADGPATTVVVASGQFLRGADLAPRGHPGDGRVEVQIYALAARERRPMRARLGRGDHVPHPRITQAAGRRVRVRWARGPRPCEVDGRARPATDRLEIAVRPAAVRVRI